MITIYAFSDGHGNLPIIEKPFDLMLIAGDNVSLSAQRDINKTKEWYLNNFVNWINDLPFNDNDSRVIFIAGNHEVAFSKLEYTEKQQLINEIYEKTYKRTIYLENEEYFFLKGETEVFRIFGTPYCKNFGRGWAYNKSQEELKELFNKIPKDCNILLTHDAPYGTSDKCFGWLFIPESVGSPALRDAIIEKTPLINIHGHLHTANHNIEKLNTTDVYCVSLLNENYDIAYEPLYLQLN